VFSPAHEKKMKDFKKTLGDFSAADLTQSADEDVCAPGCGALSKSVNGWHSRGYLPHYDGAKSLQMITYRLADALPKKVLDHFLSDFNSDKPDAAFRRQIEEYLDRGSGECWL
jgi:hypothetical protein